MLVMDIVKAPAKTELELHRRWQNRLLSNLAPTYSSSRKIEVVQIEKFDPEECPPKSNGRRICERNGEHSWFSHSMDSYHRGGLAGNLPEGFVEP